MDLEQAERRFRDLRAQRDAGTLDDSRFRLEVAKLLLRDDQGTFWLLDADEGTWFCNQGEGWEPGEPRAEGVSIAVPSSAKGRRRKRWLALGLPLVALVSLLGVAFWQGWLVAPWDWPQPAADAPVGSGGIPIQVTIGSPADGSQVTLGQEVAIESTLHSATGLDAVDRVELQVNGQAVATQPLRPKIQPGQSSLPLVQSWLPAVIGELKLSVVAYPAQGEPLGQAGLTLFVVERSVEALPESACTPGATFVADVTIPPGTAYRPGARMEKVWRVRNSGTCAWGMGYELVQVGGVDLAEPDGVPVPSTAAGEAADLTVLFEAPTVAGQYTNTWQLRSPDDRLFGPLLSLRFVVEAQAQESLRPEPPANLQAAVVEESGSLAGLAVRLTWQDRSDNEDAFRVYREDVEASIGLAPANTQLFVDRAVPCGKTLRYGVVAFNAAGASPLVETAEVSLPPCAPLDAPPALVLTVVPTQVVASETITVVFQATDDLGVTEVYIRGEGTGSIDLDTGQVFPCTGVVCAGTWPITRTTELTATLTILAIARDSSGQESEPARVQVIIVPPEQAPVP